MTKIVFFGNCQMQAIRNFYDIYLPKKDYNLQWISNNERSGETPPPDKLDVYMKATDIIIYQPLDEKHYMNTNKLKEYNKPSCQVPFVVNDGYCSFSYEPAGNRTVSGTFMDGDILKSEFKEYGFEETLKRYLTNKINFNLQDRFNKSFNELKRRDELSDISISEFILNNYKTKYCFITHSHPTPFVLNEIMKQISSFLNLPILNLNLHDSRIKNQMPWNGNPITPYDCDVFGYTFGYHNNWKELAGFLITKYYNAIYNNISDKTMINKTDMYPNGSLGW